MMQQGCTVPAEGTTEENASWARLAAVRACCLAACSRKLLKSCRMNSVSPFTAHSRSHTTSCRQNNIAGRNTAVVTSACLPLLRWLTLLFLLFMRQIIRGQWPMQARSGCKDGNVWEGAMQRCAETAALRAQAGDQAVRQGSRAPRERTHDADAVESSSSVSAQTYQPVSDRTSEVDPRGS